MPVAKRFQPQICRTLAAGLLLIILVEGVQAQSLWEDVDHSKAEATVSALVGELKATSQSPEAAESIWLERATEVLAYGVVAVDSLAAFLDSDDAAARDAALWMLDRIGGAVALPNLVKAVRTNADPLVQQAALRSLVDGSGFVQTANLLREVSATESDAATLNYAREALDELGLDPLAPLRNPSPVTEHIRSAESDAATANRRVRAIVEDALRASTLRVDGRIVAVSRAHAGVQHLREVVQMGPKAVPALAEYAWSGSGFEWVVAKELLTQLGGAAIVEPLSAVVRGHSDSNRRYSGLITLIEGTNFVTIARTLREVGQNDPDSGAGQYARQVLTAVQPNQ